LQEAHIVDNDECLRELGVELLESSGHEVNSYSSPVEYLNYVNNDNYTAPTAVITDVRMPEMSGYDLIDKVREKLPELKFVVMSGYHEADEAKRKSPCHFLAKPFSPEQFIAIADAIVGCDQEGSEAGNSTCTSLIEEANMNLWTCPLDCTECRGVDKK